MRRAVIFNYDSIFAGDIKNAISRYNFFNPGKGFSASLCRAGEYASESMAGPADVIIHSGGDGKAVREDTSGIPKLYICHSHQWKAKEEGGFVERMKDFVKGLKSIDILEDDEILGKKGKMPIMQYHTLAVTGAPRSARVLAKSRGLGENGEEIEIIEALRYPDGSLSIQGHPEEGNAAHVLYNFFDRILERKN